MDNARQKKISDILQTFMRQISQILKIAKQIEPNDINIEWLQRVVRIARDENPLMLIDKCVDKFWDNRLKIMERDTSFFVDTNAVDKYIKHDKNREWFMPMVQMIRKKLKLLTDEQTTYIWDRLNTMLKNVIEYKLLTEDYQ